MDNFNWPADIRNIPQDELDKLRPRIQQYADQAVNNALRDARMVSFLLKPAVLNKVHWSELLS
jgi:hypothetical protein